MLRALGEIGARDSLVMLRDLDPGKPRDALERAAAGASARIRQRLGEAEPGRLSLPEASPDGALSVAAPGGGLTVADDDPRVDEPAAD